MGTCVNVVVGASEAIAGIGGTIAVIIGVLAGGPKGVGEGEAFGLGVTVGPMAVGADGSGLVQAVKSKKNARSM
jgi:hypothetical protein